MITLLLSTWGSYFIRQAFKNICQCYKALSLTRSSHIWCKIHAKYYCQENGQLKPTALMLLCLNSVTLLHKVNSFGNSSMLTQTLLEESTSLFVILYTQHKSYLLWFHNSWIYLLNCYKYLLKTIFKMFIHNEISCNAMLGRQHKNILWDWEVISKHDWEVILVVVKKLYMFIFTLNKGPSVATLYFHMQSFFEKEWE